MTKANEPTSDSTEESRASAELKAQREKIRREAQVLAARYQATVDADTGTQKGSKRSSS